MNQALFKNEIEVKSPTIIANDCSKKIESPVSKIDKINIHRGRFIAIYANIEYIICEIMHKLKSQGESVQIHNCNAHRIDFLKQFKSKDTAKNSNLGKIHPILVKLEEFEKFRNLIVHAKVRLLKEDEREFLEFIAFAKNGELSSKDIREISLVEMNNIVINLANLLKNLEKQAAPLLK